MTKIDKDIFDKAKFEQRSEESKGTSHANLGEYSINRNNKSLKNWSKEICKAHK